MKNKPSAIDRIKATRKGSFTAITYRTETKTAAAFKSCKVEKLVCRVVRTGISYGQLASVKNSIASGERGEVESLPWGVWEEPLYTIRHKGELYLRVYPSAKNKVRSFYFCNGKQISKAEHDAMLTPSAKKQSAAPSCMNIKACNLIG